MQPVLSGLGESTARVMAPASMVAWDRIVLTLAEREHEMFLRLARYLAETGATDATGGELSAWADIPVTHVRPRLTGLERKGWLTRTVDVRASHAKGESPCHAYRLAVPASAIERAQVKRKTAA